MQMGMGHGPHGRCLPVLLPGVGLTTTVTVPSGLGAVESESAAAGVGAANGPPADAPPNLLKPPDAPPVPAAPPTSPPAGTWALAVGSCSTLHDMCWMMPQRLLISLNPALGLLWLPRDQPACSKADSLPAQLHAKCYPFYQGLPQSKLSHLLQVCFMLGLKQAA